MDVTPIGLDLSLTSTGIAVGAIQIAYASKMRGVARLADIGEYVVEIADHEDNPVVIVEGYSFGSRNSQAHSLGELGGVVRYLLWRSDIPFVEVPPTCRAKFATGKGNASKSAVVSAVSARTGIVWDGKGAEDRCDAWLLQEAALARLGAARFEWPKAHLDALDKIDWTPLYDVAYAD